MMTELGEHVRRLAATHQDVAAELAPIQTLERLPGWLKGRGLDLAALDLIQQDEFSFDMLLPLGPPEWLSFGMG
jgi:hypothetical protein